MNAHIPTPADPATDATDRARRLVDRQLAMLGDLAEMGLEVARAVERRAKEAGPQDDLNAVAMAYARAARAVRMALMLQSRLIRDLQALEDGVAEQAASVVARADKARIDRQDERKLQVERIVGRVAQARSDDEDEIQWFADETAERLADDGLYGDVMKRPVGEIVALICRDLGLKPDWARLAEEAWAKEEIERGEAGSPFTASPAGGGGGPRSGGEGIPLPLPHELRDSSGLAPARAPSRSATASPP
jgi:hypothetical protein